MSFMDCIDRALTAKKITGKKADEARERYTNLYKNAIDDGMAPLDAEAHASQAATTAIEIEKAQIKNRQLKQMAWSIDDWRQWEKSDVAHMNRNANAVIEGSVGASPGRISLNDYTTTAEGRIKSFLTDMIDKYSPKMVGLVYPKAGLENIVRELFSSGSTGDKAAAAFATAWTKATDYGVKLYQQAGGVLNHLDEWRMPQMQNRTKLYKLGAAEITAGGTKMTQWAADHMQWVDWEKMQWPNGARIDPGDRARVLDEVYKSIKTGGDIRIKPGQYRGAGGSVADHRFLIYKDAESWLASHEKYGDGSVYETMMSHVEGMSRRIGTSQAFGPNPALGLEQMVSNMKLVAAKADIAAGTKHPRTALGLPTTYKDEAQSAENFLRDAFQVKVKGMNSPQNGSAAIAAGLLSDARTVIMSAVLGSVYLYQGTQDFFTAALRYRLAGLPVMKSVGTYVKMFSTLDSEMPKTLMRAGFINLSQSRIAHSYARLTGLEPGGSRIAQRISDTVMRASLTEWHAAAARFTTAAEFCGALSDWRSMSFDQIPGKSMFEAHGIDAADWDRMRSTPVHNMKGHEFIFPDDHIGTSHGSEDDRYHLADKFMSMINQEAKLATIETQVSAQLMLKGTTRPGTLVGEIIRSGAMFKNFPLTMFNTHIRQGLLAPTIPGKIGYLSQVVLGMTMFGAVGTVLHDVAAGKNPQSMLDKDHVVSPEFWTRAVLASGGFGILGDWIAGNLQHGKSLGETMSGPLIEEGSDLINIAGDSGKVALGMEKSQKLRRELVRFGSRWTPGSSIWYLRAPLRAMLWDNLLKATDPHAAEVFRRRIDDAKKHTGQSFWWAPGANAPSGPPDLTTLVQK